MNISPYEFWKHALCISIDEKRAATYKKVVRYSFGIVPPIYEGFKNSNLSGAYNCELSHVSVIKMAKLMKWPFVTILEDDIFPRNDAHVYLRGLLRSIPDDAKMIPWGYLGTYGVKEYNDLFDIPMGRINGTHFYTVFESGYDMYLALYRGNQNIPADRFYRMVSPTYVPKINMAIQYNDDVSLVSRNRGYVTKGVSTTSPEGFPRIEDIVRGGEACQI